LCSRDKIGADAKYHKGREKTQMEHKVWLKYGFGSGSLFFCWKKRRVKKESEIEVVV